MNFLKFFNVLLLVVTTSGVTSSVFAQELRTSYFMDNAPVARVMNPATMPQRGYFSIPVVGSVGFSLLSNDFSFKDLFYVNNQNELVSFVDKSYDANLFLSKLSENNAFTTDLAIGILSTGWYTQKSLWTLDVGFKLNIGANIPKSMFEFLRYTVDGADWNDVQQNYRILDFKLNILSYGEVALGLARPITRQLAVGAKAKFILGLADVNLHIDEMSTAQNGDVWDMTTRGSLKGALKGAELGSEMNDQGEMYVERFDFGNPGFSGLGFGLDLGATYQLFDNLRFSAALNDIGFIRWNKNAAIAAGVNGQYQYAGVSTESEDGWDQLEDIFGNLEDVFHMQEQVGEAYTTALRSTINIGGEYTFLNNLLGVGVLSSTKTGNPKTYTELTLMGAVRPTSWFTTSLSYSFVNNSDTFGAAFNFHPSWINVFIGSDYIVFNSKKGVPQLGNSGNVYFGLAIPMSKKK